MCREYDEFFEKFNLELKVKKTTETAVLPTRGSDMAAGYDLRADIPKGSVEISPGNRVLIGTGLAVAIPEWYFGAVFARSGLAFKEGLRPSNCVGVIDADYRGEIMVALTNDSAETRVINHGDRIAQLVLIPFMGIEVTEVEEFEDKTERGAGGFGSTGKK